MKRIKELLEEIGLEADRVEMFNMSAAMAGQFVASATAITERIIELGKNPLGVAAGNGESQNLPAHVENEQPPQAERGSNT